MTNKRFETELTLVGKKIVVDVDGKSVERVLRQDEQGLFIKYDNRRVNINAAQLANFIAQGSEGEEVTTACTDQVACENNSPSTIESEISDASTVCGLCGIRYYQTGYKRLIRYLRLQFERKLGIGMVGVPP